MCYYHVSNQCCILQSKLHKIKIAGTLQVSMILDQNNVSPPQRALDQSTTGCPWMFRFICSCLSNRARRAAYATNQFLIYTFPYTMKYLEDVSQDPEQKIRYVLYCVNKKMTCMLNGSAKGNDFLYFLFIYNGMITLYASQWCSENGNNADMVCTGALK